MQAIFDEMMERVKQKEEKEARKKQVALSDFQDSLRSVHSLTTSSKWAVRSKTMEREVYPQISTLQRVQFSDTIRNASSRLIQVDSALLTLLVQLAVPDWLWRG